MTDLIVKAIKDRDSAFAKLKATIRLLHATQNELAELRVIVTENVATMANIIKERNGARDELDRLERFIEGLDRVGNQIAQHEVEPYDRYTCWGEAACDVSSKIEKLVKERDRARDECEAVSHLLHAIEEALIAASEERDDLAANLKTRDEQIVWLVELCESLPRSTPDELRDWISAARKVLASVTD